ncbi:unnamed protein product [Acanthosepion pharaonis]|uniref:Uncharacterized protein n=1 Tax=Acanthosepion pharaonis TaxID=158019 RepID=A0A812CRW3_ACAPH|nr:unnamed protein product [Sepia pharaonis]
MLDADSVLRSIWQWKYIITDLTSVFRQIPFLRLSLKYCSIVTPFRGSRLVVNKAILLPVQSDELRIVTDGSVSKRGLGATHYASRREEAAKQLAGTTLTTTSVHLQTEYMGTRRTKVTVHGVLVAINRDQLGDIFARYSEVEDILATISKAGIATGDFFIQVILTLKSFRKIPQHVDVPDKMIPVVVESRRPYCSCGASEHISKACLSLNKQQLRKCPARPPMLIGGGSQERTESASKNCPPAQLNRRSHSNNNPRNDRSLKSCTTRCRTFPANKQQHMAPPPIAQILPPTPSKMTTLKKALSPKSLAQKKTYSFPYP